MAKDENVRRIAFNLYLDNPEHKRVYDVLQQAENKNQLIRKAILSYDDTAEIRQNIPTANDVKMILDKELKEWSESMMKQMDERLASFAKELKDQVAEKRQIDFDKLK